MSADENDLAKFVAQTREGTLKQLQDLRDNLQELYVRNTKLDEENTTLKREVKSMKGQIGTALDTMKVLKEDLKKARELLNKPKVMDDLKQKVKELVPEPNKGKVDIIFHEWASSKLKVHRVATSTDIKSEGESRTDIQRSKSNKRELRELKDQFDKFKKKMKRFKPLTPSSTNLAIIEVKKEIEKVRKKVSSMKLRYRNDSSSSEQQKCVPNSNLIQKIEEIKKILEDLK